VRFPYFRAALDDAPSGHFRLAPWLVLVQPDEGAVLEVGGGKWYGKTVTPPELDPAISIIIKRENDGGAAWRINVSLLSRPAEKN
jgi:hypothetical protein